MVSPPTFSANGGGSSSSSSSGSKPQNISSKGGKVRSSKPKVKEFEIIDPMDDGGTKFGGGGGGGGGAETGSGGKKEGDGEKGFVDIVKDGVKIKLDQAIEDAKGGDIGEFMNDLTRSILTKGIHKFL